MVKPKHDPTRDQVRVIVAEAKDAVRAQLPEDEHDYTADWVYETIVRAALARRQTPEGEHNG